MDKEAKKLLELIIKRLDSMDARFDGIDSRFDGIDSRLDGMDGKLAKCATKEDVQSLRNVLEDFAGSMQAMEENSASFYQWQSDQDKKIAILNKAVGIA